MDTGKSFDRYIMQARVVPVLIVVFPLASLVFVWLSEESLGWRLLSGLVSLVLLSLLAQVGRDGGKRRQSELFRQWGGKPSVKKFRFSDSDLPWITMERLRSAVSSEMGVGLPTRSEESADPAAADEVYSACVDCIREATRLDKILHSENIGYGFRRNLWGMKSGGILCSLIGLVGSGVEAVSAFGSDQAVVPSATTVINAGLLALWVLRIKPAWVRESAEAYAERLVFAYLSQKEPVAKAVA